ncbi:winged helix-turn-helix domain-containing protein [Pseudoalteromonas sp. SMS1]|uniref:winged helix-turn-helix domain-containing protein n=1 Tax=Pseudoalteromonas sp. SMS1 TaxID=2908894 RepID=UPI001F30B476|nr:winged helix-turn-helix domain-containing protein [Pseudoalteromonas sp. SMS1]MCF2860473.1 winged helix-turn-helix domain-containing protein [Pseudoalteromonas sp. SMS1]
MRASLGDFVLDLEQRLLYLNDEEIAVEPKVMELLLYLYHCRGRYVTIEELHEQVWSDRIVTDTAVRGAVKKLRVILKDEDITSPSYIKSVPKRGYKLVCDSQPISEEPISTDESCHAEEILRTSPKIDTPIAPEITRPASVRFSQNTLLLLVFCSLVALLGGWATYSSQTWPFSVSQIEASDVNTLTEFKGEKTSLAVSKDGRYIAFTGRSFENELSQVYLYDKYEKTIRQLTTNEPSAMFVRFAQNDKALVFSNTLTGNSSLKLLPLTVAEPESAMVTLLEGRYLIADIQPGRASSEVIVQLANANQSQLMLYAIDLEGDQETRLVTVSQSDEYIVSMSTSPDRRRIVTANISAGRAQLILHDLISQQETILIDGDTPIDKVVWRNDSEILLLNEDSIRLYDLKTKQFHIVYDNVSALITSMESDHQGGLVVIKKSQERAERLYIERSFSNGVSKVIDTQPEIVSMMFDSSDDELKWVRVLKDKRNSIGSFNIKTKHINIVYQSDGKIELLDVSKDHKWIVFKEDYRLAVFSVEEQRVHYLTSSSNSCSDGVFNPSGEYILYGVQVGGRWEIQKYDIATGQSDVFLNDFRTIRTASTGYVVATEAGQLAYLESQTALPQPLNHRIGLEPITRWHVRNDKVVWSTYDHIKSYLHYFDLNSQYYHVMEDFLFSLHPRISVDRSGGRVVYLSVQINDAALQQINFH